MQEVKKALNTFAKGVIMQSRRNLTTSGTKDSGSLHKSLEYELEVHKNSFSLAFLMEDYGKFVDQGVRGKFSASKAPKSPYRFGTGSGRKGGLTKAINKWVRSKGIQFRDRKTGRFIDYDGTAFVIARSIYRTGIKPSLFFTKPFENAFKRLPDELVEQYGLSVDDFLDHAFKDFK